MQHELLNKPFLNNRDIMTLLNCSPSKASRVKSYITRELIARGKKVITTDIPTKLFIELMNLDVSTEDERAADNGETE